jgi:hypothetical protein
MMSAAVPPLRQDDIPFLTYAFLYRSPAVPICLNPDGEGYTSEGVLVMALGTELVAQAGPTGLVALIN